MDTNIQYLNILSDTIKKYSENKNGDAVKFTQRGSIDEMYFELNFSTSQYEGSILINDTAVQMIGFTIIETQNGEDYLWTDATHKYSLVQIKSLIEKCINAVINNSVPNFFDELKKQ